MRWTPEQQEAIDARGGNLLVSAAAGSGKTAVLTERIVSLIKEGVQVDELLVVTFTKAAASEMRARILMTLHKVADEGDRHLAVQAMKVERADISTLHGFCAQVCRNYFQAAGVDPTFRVADSTEAAVLRTQAMTEALVGCYAGESPAFQHAAACFSQEDLAEMADQLHHFMMARPDPWAWLEESVQMHGMQEEKYAESPWMQVFLSRIALDAQDVVEAYSRLIAFTVEIGLFEEFARAEAAQAALYVDAAKNGYDALCAIPTVVFVRLPSKRGLDKDVSGQFKALRDVAKKALQALEKRVSFLSPLSLRVEDEQETMLALSGIAEAVKEFHVRYEQLKAEKNLLDFNDLEHCALAALRNADVSAALHEKYTYVFVDEYQDSSLLQEALLQLVSRGDNLFMVGDVKQSIYRFRLAEPSLFLAKLNTYSPEQGETHRKLLLNANFRSLSLILSAINGIFDHVFTGSVMELMYGDDARLIPGRTPEHTESPVELHLMLDAESEFAESEEGEEAPTAAELSPEDRMAIRQEAEIIADRILSLQQTSEGAYKLRDMAVLMRTMRGRAAHVVEVLRSRGIAAWSDLGEDALERPEVRDIVSILQVIDNFRQDIPLLAALRGPALGITDDALANIRSACPEGSMADAILQYAEKADELAHALRLFVERVRGWALDAQVVPLDGLLRRIFEETGHYAQSGARPDGDIRQANLRMLAEHAGAYQRAQAGSLSGFLRYLQRVKEHEGLAAQELGESDDVVRVMSIHKSKGLQFPVVFIAGLGRQFTQMDARKPLAMHAQLGIAIRHVDPQLRTICTTLSREAVLEKKRQEDLAEEARVLYVAMTRAEERLILIGTPRKGAEERWSMPLPPASARSMLDWVAPIAVDSDLWQVSAYKKRREPSAAVASAPVLQVREAVYDLHPPDSAGNVVRALSWRPEQEEFAPIKQSVSSMVRVAAKLGEEEEIPSSLASLPVRPLFMESKGITASERGSAVHTLLSTVPLDVQDLDAARRTMVENGLLSPEQARVLPMRKLMAMMNGPVWQRMKRAKVLHREWPFNLRMEQEGNRTLLQGVIDCCFIEDGGWVLVDYKSDRSDDVDALVEQYRPQLALYALALERMTGLPVKERILYLLEKEAAYLV